MNDKAEEVILLAADDKPGRGPFGGHHNAFFDSICQNRPPRVHSELERQCLPSREADVVGSNAQLASSN